MEPFWDNISCLESIANFLVGIIVFCGVASVALIVYNIFF